jgi:peptide/nickel transport system permease protein
MLRVAPGDVALSILVGPDGQGTFDQSRYDQLRQELGLNKPVILDPTNLNAGSQFADWSLGIIRGDWGQSIQTERPVLEEIAGRLPTTFELTIISVIAALAIGIPLGFAMAVKQDTWIDYVLRIISIGGLAMPSFWVATLILLGLVVVFHWLPPLGYRQFLEDPLTNLQQVIWAALPLGYLLSAVIARMTRSSVLDVLPNDYIRTARAKGLKETVIMIRHVSRNSLLPVITLSGLQFASLMGGTVVVETIWNLPGLGSRLMGAISYRDYPMVQGIMLVFACIVIFTNVLMDLAYQWLDPRLRISG